MLEKDEIKPVIVVLGGYGNFGKLICQDLAKNRNIKLMIAGRNEKKAKLLQNRLQKEYPESYINTMELDRNSPELKQKLLDVHADILVHTAGPFQNQAYSVANACIDAKVHYVDIADSRQYVTNIFTLDKAALDNQIIMIAGASSVPGLASTIIDTYALKFSTLLTVEFGISPGNKVDRGLGTLASVFDYVGKPFEQLYNGQWQTVYGWQDMHRVYFGDNIGLRWQSNCDVPDLYLIPKRYPKVQSVRFYAGLELGFLHFMLWVFSWLVRWKIINNLSKFSSLIEKLSMLFVKLGTPKGGMFVHLYGTDFEYQPHEVHWQLVADTAHGLNIPVIPALIIIKKILNNELLPGARPCTNLFTIEEFDAYAKQWNIYHTTVEKQL